MKVYTGTSGYGYKEWKGNFYPAKLSAGKMLGYYAARLKTVEINNTFYRMPTPNVVASWLEQVPKGFLFAVKSPQIITHIKRLKNVREETAFFLKTVSGLEKRLGCVLFQFPASFRADHALLEDFLALIPAKTPCAFDFRSETWMNPQIFALLTKRNFCLCLEDTEEKPIKEIPVTAHYGYLRMRRMDYTDAALLEWTKKVLAQKWKKAFVFFKHEDDAAARGPQLATQFDKLVSSSADCGNSTHCK
ncbi:MAG: DUF72 domain-containing protein [Chitinivibrionales bacterium]|nr:DUF72 domain-containing protein [Chitinivibrionales bacterium]